tara:strand:- start:1744 stop:2475 length:732 start_codon:yes stop_codon:yes gene_type:complete
MQNYTFIDRYFQSQRALLDLDSIEKHDVNSLFTYLNNLHSTADKLKDLFDCSIKDNPDFRLLRIIRNYFHHVGDVDDIRMLVSVEENVHFDRMLHLIIPLETFAKSVKSFTENAMVPESHKQYQKKLKYVSREMDSISKSYSYNNDLLSNMDMFCNKPSLNLDGEVYELGFDMFRFIFNVTNLIVDSCKSINELASKPIILELGSEYSESNNIDRIDIFCSPDKMPITTTQGMIYARKIKLAT